VRRVLCLSLRFSAGSPTVSFPYLRFGFIVALALGCDDPKVSPPADGSMDRADARSLMGGPLSVATWNVENYFDAEDDPATDDMVPRQAEVEAKTEALGRVLRALDADVLVLQEVETAALLDRLAEGPLAGRGYDYRGLEDAGDPRGIDVAYLSRIPIDDTISHRTERFPGADGDRTWGFARDALELILTVGDRLVVVTTVHFRAQSDDPLAADHRLAEALKVRRMVDTRIAQGADHVLVAGDLNATPGSPTLEAMLEGDALTDLTEAVDEEDRWTFIFDRARRQLDYILGTPETAAAAEDVRILHGPEVDAASDHAPVRAELLLP
jgi:endonuclease/exonuclease/phosphatase family metal-dependent hydrolase